MQVVAGIASRGADKYQRLVRSAQRSLADQALEAARAKLPGRADQDCLTSVSHSRGVAMAAVLAAGSHARLWRLGCDVECADAPRHWGEIGAFLTGDAIARDARTACRAWTLAEAWFKAFGAWPLQSLVARAMARRQSDGDTITLASSVYWYAFAPVDGFEASIVWRGDAFKPVIARAAGCAATSGLAP